MANKKKRAAWGSKKRAQEEAAAAGVAAAHDIIAANGEASDETAPVAAEAPSIGAAIENVKNWLLPFEPDQRKQIMRAVGVFLK